MPRFHRAASYKQDAVDSPMPNSDPFATPDENEGKYSPFCDDTRPISVREKQNAYMNNFRINPDDSHEKRETKYRTLLEEINAEPILDDDDISSLGIDGSTDDFFTANTPPAGAHIGNNRPFDNDAITPARPIKLNSSSMEQGMMSKSTSASDLSARGGGNGAGQQSSKKPTGNSSTLSYKPGQSKSLHSSSALMDSFERSPAPYPANSANRSLTPPPNP